MGLEMVELILEVEETFGIVIPLEEASRMATVGDLYDFLIKAQVEQRAALTGDGDAAICLRSRAFFKLRRAAEKLGAEKRLRPADSISKILPATARNEYWNRLAVESQFELPRLERPRWLVIFCKIVVPSFSVCVGLLVGQFGVAMGWVIGTFVLLLVGMLAIELTKPFAVHPAKQFATLRGLTEMTLAKNFPMLRDRCQGAGEGNIWVTLTSMIVEQLGVDADEVTPTANFVSDLGCG